MAPLTAAEKQKRYRDRLRQTNPEKYSTILKNNAERNRKYRKKVKESTTEEEKNKQRLKWREKKRKERKKESNNTASDEERKFTQQRTIKRIYRMWITKKAQYESKINLLNKKVNRFRKQNSRLMKKVAQLEKLISHPEDAKENIIIPDPTENNNIMSPLSKSCSFIDQNLPNVTSEEKEKVKRILLDHNILTNAVQDAYKNTKNNNERNIFKKITEHEYVTKYKMKRKVSLILGLKGRARRIKQYKNTRNKKTVEEIRQFYERDDVSRATSGKKEVKTSKKVKRQRRYLLKTQKDLFKKFKDEGGKAKYSTFKKHRPFYVLHPKLSNRDTCACAKHENFILKTEKLYTLGMIDTKNVDDILAKVNCDPNSIDCAYRQCSTCRDNVITFDWAGYSKDELVVWEEFAREKHEYVDKNSGNNKTTEKMVKREKSDTMISFTDSYNSDLNAFSKHVYNIKHQYSQYLSCIKKMTANEVVVHIDFSENYTCKYAKEVQSMHWGASKPQITIHTGVIYAKNREPETFASISPNNEHGPEAIWAHLTPVLHYIRKILPNVTGIHFFSDGPTSQYKQKKNFYFFSKMTEEMGFPNSTWNFSEASHGKGAADGVGAAVKRRLDNCVSQGIDVPNAETAYDILQNSDSSVLTFYIPQDSIQNFSVSEDLIPVPRTMTLHQIVKTESVNTIRYRCLSCFCCDMISFRGSCDCQNIKSHKLYNEQKQPTASIRTEEKNSLEMNCFEKDKKIPKETIKTEKTVTNKVQMLSDVRYLPENQGYIDMRKIDASKFITVPVETDLSRSKKNKTPDDIYRNPVPSTSKEGLMTTKKFEHKSLKRKRPHFSDDSTDTDAENYSLHDSSDYCYEEEFLDEEFLGLQIEQNEIKITRPGKSTKIEDKQTRKYDKNVQIEEDEINTTNLENKTQVKDKENTTMEPNQGSDYFYEEEFLDEVFLGSQIEQNEIKITGPGKRSKIEDKKRKRRQHDDKVHIEEEEINTTDLENMIQVKEKVSKTVEPNQGIQMVHKWYTNGKMISTTGPVNITQIGETEKTAKHDQLEHKKKKEKNKTKYDKIVRMEEEEIITTGPRNIIRIGEQEKTAEHDQIIQKETNTKEYHEKLRIEEEEIITTGSINLIQIGEKENKTAENDQIIQKDNKEMTAERDQNIKNEEKEKKTTEYYEKVQMGEEVIITTGPRNTMQIGEKENKTAERDQIVQIEEKEKTSEHDQTLHKMEKHQKIREYDEIVQVEEEEINTIGPKNIIEIGEKVKNTAEYDKIVEKEVKQKTTKDYDETELKEGDSIIVKYYEKRTWKFYIGFIEEIIEQEGDNITYFNMYFLKTVKHPLKFIKPRKIDRDLVPTTNVVKKVQLILSSKEYFLKNETSDKIYFN